jgi:hypothetical protein
VRALADGNRWGEEVDCRRIVIVALTALAMPASASATTISVPAGGTDPATGSAGACAVSGSGESCPTLRDAVAFANGLGADSNPTIQLSAGSFDLSQGSVSPGIAMTIEGAGDSGSGASTIRQTALFAVLTPSAALTLQDLVVTGGHVVGVDGTSVSPNAPEVFASGINAGGALTLTRVTVTGNQVVGGAGFSPLAGTGGNGGSVLGSAIWSGSSAVTISDSTISDNSATGGAGGGSTGGGGGGSGGDVLSGAVGPGQVMATNTTFTNNVATGGAGGSSAAGPGGDGGSVRGAAISSTGLTLTGSAVSNNSSAAGNGGAMTGVINDNGGDGGGAEGAIFAQETGAVTITATLVSANHTTGGNGGDSSGVGATGGAAGGGTGGGASIGVAGSAPVSIDSSVISNNILSSGTPGSDTATTGHGGSAGEVDGGGIVIGDAGATSITNSTFSGNQVTLAPPGAGASGTSGLGAEANGGALALDVPALIVNSTISGNTVQSQSGAGGGEGSEGGGIAFLPPSGTLGLYSDTLAGNTAQASPAIQIAGANIGSGGGTVALQDTAIASPLPSSAPNCYPTPGGPFTDNGHNLEDTSTSTCGLTAGHNDVIGSSPQLPSAVGANGGTTGPTDPTTGYVGTFTLAPAVGSPLIGAGGPCINPLAAGSPPLTVDQRGFARPATCDIGAFQTQPVKLTGAPAITSTPAVGKTLTCSTGTLAATGDGTMTATGSIGALALSYTWMSGTSTVATTSTYKVAAGDAGHSITCTETATGAYGNASATSAAVTIPKPAPPSVALTAVSQAHKSWAEKKGKRKHKVSIGTSFKFTLNEAATVKFTFTTTLKGRKVKHKCVAQTKHNKHAPKCTKTITAGTLTVAGRAGRDTKPFSGKIGRHVLAPGAYKLTITAASGPTHSSKTLRFTIVA